MRDAGPGATGRAARRAASGTRHTTCETRRRSPSVLRIGSLAGKESGEGTVVVSKVRAGGDARAAMGDGVGEGEGARGARALGASRRLLSSGEEIHHASEQI